MKYTYCENFWVYGMSFQFEEVDKHSFQETKLASYFDILSTIVAEQIVKI